MGDDAATKCGETREPSAADPSARRFEIEGRNLGYPTEFRDGSSIGGLFVVGAQAANELISESGFEVAEIAPRRACFALTYVHYTDTDCGAYEEIDFDTSGERATCVLRMRGSEVLRYSVRAKGSRRPGPITSPVYSSFEGAKHESHLIQEYRDTGISPGGGRLKLGDHPLAQQLRGLGLPRRPLLATWNGRIHFRMSAPEKL